MKKLVYNEIIELFEFLGEDKKNKIPSSFWNYAEKNKLENYDKNKIINDIWNNTLSQEAKNIYGALKIKYLCDNDLEKSILMKLYVHSAETINKKKQSKDINLKEIDETFKIRKNNYLYQNKENNNNLIILKTKWYKKIVTKILSIFKKL